MTRQKLHVTPRSVWTETGFTIGPNTGVHSAWLGNTPLLPLRFEVLNPELRFNQCFSRWELAKLSAWFAWQAVRRWRKEH